MKFVVLVLVLTVIHYSQNFELTAEQKAIRDECGKQEKIDMAVVSKAIDSLEYPNDRSFKCFLKCTMVKQNFMTEAGQINVENFKNANLPIKMTPEKSASIMDACKGVKGADACEIAYEFGRCFSQQLLMSLAV